MQKMIFNEQPMKIITAIKTEDTFEYLGFSGIICACLTKYTPFNYKDNCNSHLSEIESRKNQKLSKCKNYT